jgi:hypothetical protein
MVQALLRELVEKVGGATSFIRAGMVFGLLANTPSAQSKKAAAAEACSDNVDRKALRCIAAYIAVHSSS